MGMYKYCPTIIVRDHNSTIAFEQAQKLGYNGPFDKKKLLTFYKKLDMSKFIFSRPERNCLNGLAPCYPTSPYHIVHDFGENPTVPRVSKEKDLESMARIPLMVGFCERESVMGFLPAFGTAMMDNFYTSIRQNFWGWGSKLNESQIKLLQKRVESYYVNGKPIEKASLERKCDIQTDMALSDVYSSLINVVAADCPSSVYVYKFEFEGNVPKMKDIFQFIFSEPVNGTFHGDDYSYWHNSAYANNVKQSSLTPETEKMVKTFTKLVSTFAKTGNPNYDGITTQWKPTTVENPCYLSINNDLHMVDGKLNGPRMEFWENLKKELESNDPTAEISDQLEGQHFVIE